MPYDATHPPPRGFLYLLAWILARILSPTGRKRANERIKALADYAEQSHVPGKISTVEYRKNTLAVEIIFNANAQSDDDDQLCLVLAMTSTWAAIFLADDDPVGPITLGALSMTPAEVFAAVEMTSPFK